MVSLDEVHIIYYTDITWTAWHLSAPATELVLTHCGVMIPYGNRDLGQHWFTISKVHLIRIHLCTILQEVLLLPSITKISLKITFLKFLWNLPGANELKILFRPEKIKCLHYGTGVRGIQQWSVESPHKGPVRQFHNIIMTIWKNLYLSPLSKQFVLFLRQCLLNICITDWQLLQGRTA